MDEIRIFEARISIVVGDDSVIRAFVRMPDGRSKHAEGRDEVNKFLGEIRMAKDLLLLAEAAMMAVSLIPLGHRVEIERPSAPRYSCFRRNGRPIALDENDLDSVLEKIERTPEDGDASSSPSFR